MCFGDVWCWQAGDALSRLLPRWRSAARSGRCAGRWLRKSFVSQRRTSWNPYHCWIAPAGVGRRRPPPASTKALPPRNKGRRYPPDPPTVEEIIAVMRAAGERPEGVRLRGVIVVLWRAGLRISEALALNETDLDPDRGVAAHPPRQGRQASRGRNGPVGVGAPRAMAPATERRCRPGRCSASCAVPRAGGPARRPGIRAQLHHAARAADVRRRFAPHQLTHAHAVEMSREGISLIVIQRQLGHADLAITSRYLRGIDNTEIIAAVHDRPGSDGPGRPAARPSPLIRRSPCCAAAFPSVWPRAGAASQRILAACRRCR